MSEEKSNNSTKRLVKILVIVGIGVPILVELMTLFNLIDAQIFGGDDNDRNTEQISEVRGIAQGDSLFKEYPAIVTVDTIRVDVSAREWRFKLGLRAIDSVDQDELKLQIDSLRLQSEKILLGDDADIWEIANKLPATVHGDWELPNGDIPTMLYISSYQKVSEDSSAQIQQEVPLDKIPVRYDQ